MITVGAFEAKTHLSALLDKVEAGEEIVITRHGKTIARIIGDEAAAITRRREAAKELRELAKGSSLGGLSWKDLRDEGRK